MAATKERKLNLSNFKKKYRGKGRVAKMRKKELPMISKKLSRKKAKKRGR